MRRHSVQQRNALQHTLTVRICSIFYADDDFYHFMDVETYDQIDLPKDEVGDALKFVKENEMCKVCSHKGNVFAVEPPLFVELTVTETEPRLQG